MAQEPKFPAAKNEDPSLEAVPTSREAETQEVSGWSEEETLHRNLKPRHISMIAIGGSVGTGLIIGSYVLQRICMLFCS